MQSNLASFPSALIHTRPEQDPLVEEFVHQDMLIKCYECVPIYGCVGARLLFRNNNLFMVAFSFKRP